MSIEGKPIEIEFQDLQSRGLITFSVGGEKHTAGVEFKETKLRCFANSISFAALLILLGGSFVKLGEGKTLGVLN